MDKVFLSKSSYCDCLQCEKIYWMKKHKKQEASAEANDSALSRGKVVGEFAKGLFKDPVDVAVDEDITLRVQKTENILKDTPNVITEASFIFNNNFIKSFNESFDFWQVSWSIKIHFSIWNFYQFKNFFTWFIFFHYTNTIIIKFMI